MKTNYYSKTIHNGLLLIGLLLCINISLAQKARRLNVNQILNTFSGLDNHRPMALKSNFNMNKENNSKTLNERLIAESYYTEVDKINDSTYYTYSNNRGGNDPYVNDQIAYQEFNFWPDFDERVEMRVNGDLLVNYEKYIRTYDAHNNLLEENRYGWSGDDWDSNKYSKNYFYNELDNITNLSATTSTRDYQINFTYDDSNKLIEEEQHGSPWLNDYRQTYFYDVDGRIIAKNHESYWQNGVFEHKDSIAYTYDTYGNLIEFSDYDNLSGGPLAPYIRSFYTYDANNRVTESLYQYYESGNWVDDSKMETTYLDGSIEDYPIQFLLQNWVNDQWENYTLLTYSYTFNPNLVNVEAVSSQWNGTDWELKTKEIYAFNSNGHYTSYEDLEFTEGNWIFGYKYYYYYETYDDVSLSINNETKPLTFQLVSNPVTNQLSFTGNIAYQEDIVFFLYNMQGQLILQQKSHLEAGKNTFTIQVNHLTSGMYMFNLQSKNRFFSGKVIKD